MPTPVWTPGTIYPTGSIVVPTGPGIAPSPVFANPNFTSSATGWTLGGGGSPTWSATGGFSDPGCVVVSASGETNDGSVSSAPFPVSPGQTISFGYMARMASGSVGTSCSAQLYWLDGALAPVGPAVIGPSRSRGSVGSGWVSCQVSASAPAGAAYVVVFSSMNVSAAGLNVIYVDNFTISSTGGGPPTGLVYKAVQPGIGTSASSEPVWPTTVGLTVVDGTVTWQAVIATRITYKAVPILKSGAVEPTWPVGVGSAVADNTISWVTDSRQATQAPNSKVVTIAQSKVYAADKDIIRYSATVNPLDWTSTDDAGYLPSGLNQNGSNDTEVLNTYRGSLVSFSSTTFQNWQVDPDPANMSLLDGMEGIGSTWQHAAQPVAKDLFYLAKLGVRTVGISVGSTNLVNGDVGMPIDPLVRQSVKFAEANEIDPLGLYYPSLGQYWLTFPLDGLTGPSVSGEAPDGVQDEAYSFAYTTTPGDAPIDRTVLTSGPLPAGWLWDEATATISHPTTPIQAGAISLKMRVYDTNGLWADHADTLSIMELYLLLVTGSAITGGAPMMARAIALTEPEFTGVPQASGADLLASSPAHHGGMWLVVSSVGARYSTDNMTTWASGALTSPGGVAPVAGLDAGWLAIRQNQEVASVYSAPPTPATFTHETALVSTLSNGNPGDAGASSVMFTANSQYFLCRMKATRALYRSNTPDGPYAALWDVYKEQAAGRDPNGAHIVGWFDLAFFDGEWYAIIMWHFDEGFQRYKIIKTADLENWDTFDVVVDVARADSAHKPAQFAVNESALVAYTTGGKLWTSANDWAMPLETGLTQTAGSNDEGVVLFGGKRIVTANGLFYCIGNTSTMVVFNPLTLEVSAPISIPVNSTVGIAVGPYVEAP